MDWNALVEEGRKVASRKERDQWHLGDLADKVETDYGKESLGRYAQEIGDNCTSLRAYRATVRKWPDKKVRPLTFSVASALNRHPERAKIVQENPDMTRDQARAIMKEWREANPPKNPRKKKPEPAYHGPLNPRAIEEEIRQRVQEGIDAWMVKFRPHLEDAMAVKNGRKGLVTREEAATVMRCLHPDNSASSGMRSKAFIIWQRIEHLLMSERDAPTVIPLRRRKAS